MATNCGQRRAPCGGEVRLADLAAGRLALTHRAFAGRADWRAASYLRDLLMDCGLLLAAARLQGRLAPQRVVGCEFADRRTRARFMSAAHGRRRG